MHNLPDNAVEFPRGRSPAMIEEHETLRILLVEDNPDDAELLTASLHDADMAVSVHRVDDDPGLRKALEDEWDLVVTDFALPTMGGLEVVRRVRELAHPPPVIVVSGTVGEELAVESIREGAVDYLLKDRLVRFPAAVRRAVETHRLNAQSRRLRQDLETQRSLSEAVMSSLNAQIAVLDHAGGMIAANSAWRDYTRDNPELGLPADPVGENYLEHCRGGRSLISADLAGAAADGIRQVLERSLPSYQLDYPCTERGEPAWYSMSVLPLSGHRSGAVVSHQSITERILADSDRRLISRAVHVMSEALMILDLELRIISVNQAFGNITGFAVDEVEGMLPPQWPREHAGEELVAQIGDQLKRQNFWQGELICERSDGSTYREQCRIAPVRDESGEIRSYVGVFEDVTDLNEYARRLEHLARYDDDTGLANRRYFLEELDRMIAGHDGVACLQMRLLKGRLIGDSFGHDIELKFLTVAAGRVQASLGAGEICGRAGDNEFVVAMPSASPEDAMRRAETIQKLFDETILLGHQRLYSDVSIGISHTAGAGTSAETLMRQSDVAMNSARHQSGSRPCLFQPSMGDHLAANLELAGELLNASERHEFSLAYQPRFRLADGHVANLEALLRWNHPRMGPISPEVFVPVAEETGLILEIGRWVIQTALSQLGGWRAQGLDVAGVAINLSALQCQESDLPAWITARVAEAGLSPADVELEITESTVLDIHGEVNQNLIALREAGFRLAIDDFGTGFSSLAYLKHLKAHTLKVDRSFVTELPEATQDREIVRAIAAVAQSLDMCLVAEGVETEAQEAFLRELGCDQVQGFRYARPMDAAAIEENFEGHHQLLVATG